MINTEETQPNNSFSFQLNEFHNTYINFHIGKLSDYNAIKKDKGQRKIFCNKYPFLQKGNMNCKSLIHLLFKEPEFNRFNTESFKKRLYKYCSKKIRQIHKHGQSAKTQIACEKIVSDLKKDIITIAITKNSLLANKQFTSRFINYLKKLGYTNLNEIIMVISSEKNNLGSNATHCKNLDEAWSKITDTNNNFKVIFMCSNKTRINDINDLLLKYRTVRFDSSPPKDIVIQYDEAHNLMGGIPPFREHIESMLLFDFVKELVPITASGNPIHDNENPLWMEKDIKENRINFVNDKLYNSRILSTDSNYSAINDAIKVIFWDFYENKKHSNVFTRDIFDEVYNNNGKYEKMGYVNACDLPMLGDEEQVMNCVKTILENTVEIPYEFGYNSTESEVRSEKIFEDDKFNLHICITPGRKIITKLLGDFAVRQAFNPVVIMMYDSINHYKYKDLETGKIIGSNREGGIKLKEGQEFNDCLYEWLNEKKLQNRCAIIFGNYQNVGESNTFVHNCLGYVRSTILPLGCNLTPEQKYQFLLRNCFLLDRFKGLDKTNITKFIISNISGIEAAELYESINDDLVQDLINNPNNEVADDADDNSVIEHANNTEIVETVRVPGKTTIIPVQYKIEDFDSDNIKRLQDIMRKDTRKKEDKDEFKRLILDSIKEEAISVIDKNKEHIKLDDYTLFPFRCYKESSKAEYRFKLLHDNFMLNSPIYINGDGEYTPGQCSFYGCLKRHISEGHTNYPHTFYLTFAN